MVECKTGNAKERVKARLLSRIEECKVILKEVVQYEGWAWERGPILEHQTLEKRTSARLDYLYNVLHPCGSTRFSENCYSVPFDWTLPF